MSIVLFNTASGKKEVFEPREPGKARIYVCGVTVYDYCHIGHARVMVAFDVIVRYLRAVGLDVTYVRNFTDIDDKIIKRANELGISIFELTEKFIQAFHDDMDALNLAPADVEPKATDHLKEMQEMIGILIDKGIAYEKEGDVYYAVERFPGYGKLSGRNLEDLEAGARVEVDGRKQSPLDFALWKSSKPDEPSWPSPWGEGRPGWHIECSAMSSKYLGESFDIHGGGRDLIFPHHENEIAQSEGCSGKHWVNYWLHNGFVNVINTEGESEKMSKSLGNFFTLKDVLKEYGGEVIRLFILNSHYRSPLEFGVQPLQAAHAALDRLYTALDGAKRILGALPKRKTLSREGLMGHYQVHIDRFFAAMDDDFNTSQALAVMYEMAREVNRAIDLGDRERLMLATTVLRRMGEVLGIANGDPDAFFHAAKESQMNVDPEEIEALIVKRQEARQNKDFAEADRIRDELKEQGVILEDGKDGTTWKCE